MTFTMGQCQQQIPLLQGTVNICWYVSTSKVMSPTSVVLNLEEMPTGTLDYINLQDVAHSSNVQKVLNINFITF